MTSELIRCVQCGRLHERVEAARLLSWMRLLEDEALDVARLLAREPDETVQKYLVEALARHSDHALRDAVRAGCNYRVRLKIVRAAAFPDLLVWMFERERSRKVKHAILDKLSEMAHCDALRQLAARVKDSGDRSLRRKMAHVLACVGVSSRSSPIWSGRRWFSMRRRWPSSWLIAQAVAFLFLLCSREYCLS